MYFVGKLCVLLQMPLKIDVYRPKGDIFMNLRVRPRSSRTYVPVLLFKHGSAADLGPAVNRQPLFTPDVTRRAWMAAIFCFRGIFLLNFDIFRNLEKFCLSAFWLSLIHI